MVPGGEHAGEPVRDPGPARAAQPRRHTCPRRDRRQRLGERSSRTRALSAAPASLVPHQRQRSLTVGQVPRMGGRPALQRGRERPARRARRRAQVLGGHMHHPHAILDKLHLANRQPLDPQQQRGIAAIRLDLDCLNLRTLDQARDLTFVTMNCLDNSHDHRGHGPRRVTTQDHRARPSSMSRLCPPLARCTEPRRHHDHRLEPGRARGHPHRRLSVPRRFHRRQARRSRTRHALRAVGTHGRSYRRAPARMGSHRERPRAAVLTRDTATRRRRRP